MFGISECCLPDEPMMDVGDIRTILDDCDFEFSHAYPYGTLKDAPAIQGSSCWQYSATSTSQSQSQSQSQNGQTTADGSERCSAFHAPDSTYFQLGSSIQIQTDRSAFYPYPGRSATSLAHHAFMPTIAQSPKFVPAVTYGGLVSTAVEHVFKQPADLGHHASRDQRDDLSASRAEADRFAIYEAADGQRARPSQPTASAPCCQYSPVTPIDVVKPRLERSDEPTTSVHQPDGECDEKLQLATLKDTIRERVQSRMRALGKALVLVEEKPKVPEKITQQSLQKRLVRRERNKVAARRTRARRKELEEGLNEEKRRLLKIVNKRKELLAKLSNEFRQLRQLTISHLASETDSCTNRQELLKFLHTAYESQPDLEVAGDSEAGTDAYDV